MKNKSYLEFSKKVAELNSSMGYSERPLTQYLEPDEDLMDYEGYSQYAKKFNLKKSDMLDIKDIATTTAAHQRSGQKSMMRTKLTIVTEDLKKVLKDLDALIQTRQTHQEEVGVVSEKISNGLGLNIDLAYLIGFLHDIGHTWNGHTGERILSSIGRLKNCGYMVHNAMGAYILERENIVDRIINKLKENHPKMKEEEFKEFMSYLIDGIVSHNGEGVIGKILPKDKDSEEMAEEIRKCFTEKGFDKKIMPATMEGAVIRYADIIAYTRSDILDGFRSRDKNGKKILTGFDDEYLSIIGTCLARKNNFKDIMRFEEKILLEMYGLTNRIDKLSQLQDKGITPEDKLEIERSKKELEFIGAMYKKFEQYKIKYAKDYIKGIKPKSEVKTQVTDMMKDVFIRDLIETSKDKEYITMSPLIRRTLFALRDLNVRKIVPYTRRTFESEQLPIAANSFVDSITNVLLETGVAYELIPEDIKKEVKSAYSNEHHKEREEEINKDEKLEFERKICHYYRNQKPGRLQYMYKNVEDAMRDITKHDIAIALGEEKYDGELKEIYELTKITPIKRKIGQMGKTSETMTESDKQKLLEQLLEEKEKDIEKIIANKMVIEYIGGMTDNTILLTLLNSNFLSINDVMEGYDRPGKEENQIIDSGVEANKKAFAASLNKMIYPDDKKEHEISL